MTEGDQLFKLTVGNLEAEAGYYYTDDAYVSVYISVYQALNRETQEYDLLDRCAEPLDVYPGITLDDIQEQLVLQTYKNFTTSCKILSSYPMIRSFSRRSRLAQ